MEDQHTPGPWSVLREGDESYTIQNLDIDEIVVWEIGGIDNEANARLIATVPELHTICESVLWLGNNIHNVIDDPIRFQMYFEHILIEARAAIAKARGEI